jgi:acyl-homoserine lactone acylase PvdQ
MAVMEIALFAVEFGPKVKPNHYYRGNSGNTQSKHFYDQAEMYQKVNSKTFYFTKRYTEACRKIYHPGE